MRTTLTQYRSTLIAAALATAGLATAPVAGAHERGWRGHEAERFWQPIAAPREFRPRYGIPYRPWVEVARVCDGREYLPVRFPARAARAWAVDPALGLRARL